jgi:hypothetical protein
VRIVERVEDLEVLAARPGGKIDDAHDGLVTRCQRILSNQRMAITRGCASVYPISNPLIRCLSADISISV